VNAPEHDAGLPAGWWRRVRHDLRSAIAPVRMATQLLRGGRVDANEREEALQVIDRQLEHLLATVEDIGDLLAVQAGTLSLAPARHDANLLLDVVCGRGALVRELGSRKLQLRCEPCAREIAAMHDPARVAALLEFLLLRMAAHAPAGGELVLGLRPDEGGVLRLSGAGNAVSKDAELLYLQGIDSGQGEPGLRVMLLRQLLLASGMELRAMDENALELRFPGAS